MRLFFIIPTDLHRLQFWFLVEGFFLVMNYPIAVAALWITPKLRLHLHFRIIAEFIWTQYSVFLISRTIILFYQYGVFSYDKPEENAVIVACSWLRTFYPILALTGAFWITIEREFSFYFIYDYEYHPRLWIPFGIIFIDAASAATSCSFYTFGRSPSSIKSFSEWVPILPLLSLGIFVGALSGFTYLYQYWRSYKLNTALKNRKPCKLRYSLSVRYQLEENLWFGKIMRNGIIALVFVMTSVGITFIASKLPYFDEETRQLLDCAYNITCAANGPILLAGLLLHNRYFIGKFKSLFFKTTKFPAEEEGDVYFIQLIHQWEEPLDLDSKKYNS